MKNLRKLLAVLLLVSFIPNGFSNSFGTGETFRGTSFYGTSCQGADATFYGASGCSDLSDLLAFGNLTFYKDYANNQSILNADYSLGVPTATFTATRASGSPGTYVTSDGIVATMPASNNTPRFTQGFYDDTGFVSRRGILIEAAATNLITKSTLFADAIWAISNTTDLTISDGSAASPDGNTAASTITSNATDSNLLITTAATMRTFSVWLKRKTGTGTIEITANGGTTWVAVTLTTSWARFQVVAPSQASQKFGIRIRTSGDAIYAWGAQAETGVVATTYIPTSGSSLARGAEALTYPVSGNRTNSTETISMKFTPLGGGFVSSGTTRVLLDNGDGVVKRRVLQGVSGSSTFNFIPDTALAVASATGTVVSSGVSYVVTASCSSTGDPNVTLYYMRYPERTSNTDWTVTDLGTNFYVGSRYSSTLQFNGIIEGIAIYSNVLSSSTVASLYEIFSGRTMKSEVYVSNSGDDRNTGADSSHPYATTRFANSMINTSSATVNLDRGSSFTSLYDIYQNSLTIKDYGSGAIPVFNNSGVANCIYNYNSTATVLSNLECKNSSSDGVVFAGASTGTVTGVIAHDTGNDGFKQLNTSAVNWFDSESYNNTTSATADGFSHHDTSTSNHFNVYYHDNTNGVSNIPPSVANIYDSTIENNTRTNIREVSGAGSGTIGIVRVYRSLIGPVTAGTGYAISDETNSPMTIELYSSIVYGAPSTRYAVSLSQATSTFKSYNTIFHNNSYTLNLNDNVSEIRNSIFTGSTNDQYINFASSAGVTNLTMSNTLFDVTNSNVSNQDVAFNAKFNGADMLYSSDPLYVSAGTDYSLQAGSPAIDTGTTLAASVLAYDGVSRPVGVAYDIGAYER